MTKYYYFDGKNVFCMGNDITDELKDYHATDEIIKFILDNFKIDISDLCTADNNVIIIPKNICPQNSIITI